jgi:hypothetical protein
MRPDPSGEDARVMAIAGEIIYSAPGWPSPERIETIEGRLNELARTA